MRRNEDILWKGILEDAFDDFLRFIEPEAEHLLDLERGFDFLDKELLQVVPSKENRPSSKIVDKLAKVYSKSGHEEYILVHVEVQGKYQKDFGKRMFTYYYHLFDKYNKHISAYAIFTEPNTIERPDFFKIELLSTSLLYTFKTYKIANQNEEELLASNNPFALVVLAAKTVLMSKKIKDNLQRDQKLLAVKTNLIKQLFLKGLNKEKIRIIMNFINYYINFDDNEMNIKFEKQLNQLKKERAIMGLEELLLEDAKNQGLKLGKSQGLKQGFKQGAKEKDKQNKEEFVRNLIIKLNMSDEQICNVVPVSLNFVKKERIKICTN